MASRPSNVGGYIPILPASFPPLVRRPTASKRHFCARVQQGGTHPKKQNPRKGHLKARHGVLYPCGYPYIPSPKNAAQRPPEARAGHKATPAHSITSKPGYYHLFRARESTAQRSAIWSYQAQRGPSHVGGLQAISGVRPFAASISARMSACSSAPLSFIGHSFPRVRLS